MTENQEQTSFELYSYVNNKGQKVFTPNLEFAYLMAEKYGTKEVFVEKH